MRITMAPFEFLEVIGVFCDYLGVENLCHAFMMPSTKRNSIRSSSSGAKIARLGDAAFTCVSLPYSHAHSGAAIKANPPRGGGANTKGLSLGERRPGCRIDGRLRGVVFVRPEYAPIDVEGDACRNSVCAPAGERVWWG